MPTLATEPEQAEGIGNEGVIIEGGLRQFSVVKLKEVQ